MPRDDIAWHGVRHYYLADCDEDGNIRNLWIYPHAWTRNTDFSCFRGLGRHVRIVGTREARVYMVHCIRAVDPDCGVASNQGSYTIEQVIESFEKLCYGMQTLFD